MLEPPKQLTCNEVRGRVEQGSLTRPLYVRAIDDDGYEYDVILKVRHPDSNRGHFGPTSLACELICMVIARAIGFTVPDYCVVQTPRELADAPLRHDIKELIRQNPGPNFGSVFIEGSSPWVPPDEGNHVSDIICADLEDVLVFDSAVVNGDRKEEKSNLLWNGGNLIPIDHSLAIPVHQWTDEQIAESPLFPEQQVRAHCSFPSLAGLGREFSGLLENWRDTVTAEDITELRTFIPEDWEREAGDLDRIFTFLQGRGGQFDATTEHLRRIVQ